MNGKSHYVVGAAVAGVTTYALIQLHELISQHAPDVVAKVFSPPAALITADYVGRSVTTLKDALDGNFNLTKLAIRNPGELEQMSASLFSVTAGTATTVLTVLFNWLIILAVGMLSGLFPDIDHGGSTISQGGKHLGHLIHSRGVWGLFLKLLFWLVNLFTQTLSWLAGFLGGHRGPVHTASAMLIVSVGVGTASNGLWSLPFYGVVFGAGYLSHLIIDSPNPTGIMWLWPASRKYFHLGLPKSLHFHSGSPLANLLVQLVAEVVFGLTAYSVAVSEFASVSDVSAVVRSVTNSNSNSNSTSPIGDLNSLSVSTTIGLVVVLVIVGALALSSLYSFFQGLRNQSWQQGQGQSY